MSDVNQTTPDQNVSDASTSSTSAPAAVGEHTETDEQATIDKASNHNRRLGLAMVVSIGLGYQPMGDAIMGVGPLADALVRYMVVLVSCVAAVMLIGYLLDSASSSESEAGESLD